MLETKHIDELIKKLCDTIPPGLREIQKDLEHNFRSVLQSWFAKLDLVTREEFDAQVNVLKRTRAKLTQLEKQLAELEKHRKG